MNWILKKESWSNRVVFTVTNTADAFREENMRSVNKAPQIGKGFMEMTSGYLSHSSSDLVSIRDHISEGKCTATCEKHWTTLNSPDL